MRIIVYTENVGIGKQECDFSVEKQNFASRVGGVDIYDENGVARKSEGYVKMGHMGRHARRGFGKLKRRVRKTQNFASLRGGNRYVFEASKC